MEALNLHHYAARPDLLAPPVLRTVEAVGDQAVKSEMFVAEINPANMAGETFCATYGVAREHGANCVVMKATRGNRTWYVAGLVPVGSRMDMGGTVRRRLGARVVSVAPLQEMLEMTAMEYGSITVVGLPMDWAVLVDAKLCNLDHVFIGSGYARSKLRVPGAFLRLLPNATACSDLAQ